jgi:hypothetical protein
VSRAIQIGGACPHEKERKKHLNTKGFVKEIAAGGAVAAVAGALSAGCSKTGKGSTSAAIFFPEKAASFRLH